MRTKTALELGHHHARLFIQQATQWRTGVDDSIMLKHASGPS
jgi:hypothetical protein